MANSYEKACLGKVKYKSRKTAKQASKNVRRKGHGHLFPYPCPYGPHWHLGHNKRKEASCNPKFVIMDVTNPDDPRPISDPYKYQGAAENRRRLHAALSPRRKYRIVEV